MLSIRHKFLLLQCVTVVATTLFLGALSYSLFIPAIFKLQKQHLEHTSREAAKDLHSYFSKLSQVIESLDLEGFHSKYGDLPLEELFVRHFSKFSGTFPQIIYLNEKRQETIRLIDTRPSDYFYDQQDNPAVVAALAEPNTVQMLITPDAPGVEEPVLQLAINRIGYFGDEFLGTLLVNVPLTETIQKLKNIHGKNESVLYLVDDRQALLNSTAGPLFSKLQNSLPNQPERHQFLQQDMFIASKEIEGSSWRVVSAMPYSVFVRELNNLKILAALTCIMVTLLSAALSARLLRHLTRNISLLIEHAEKVGSGDYEQHLELYRDREFEKLGEAINSMTQDIARHRNMRESLQQIQQSIIDPLIVADQQGRITQVNHATLEMIGCEESNLIGKPLADFFPDPPQLLTEANFASALLRKRVSNVETQIETHTGKRISVLFSSSPVPGRNIEMGVVGIMKNIDELVSARLAREHALREAEDAHRRIDALLKSVADGLIVTDLSGKVLLHNQPSEQLLGNPQQPLFQKVLKALPEPEGSESLPPFDISLPAEDNSPHRIIQVHSSPVLDHRGSLTGMVSMLRDVTRERALEQIKTEFISTAAHELTTPLTSIVGYSELLLDRELTDRFSSDQKRDFMEEILNRSESLSKIVDDLLNISRIESGQPIPLDIQPTRIEPLLERTIHNFQLISEKHRFTALLPETADRQVLVDEARILQVLENLLSNAVKYSAENTTITLKSCYEQDCYKIEIIDQGIGMNKEQLERVFDKFYRCDASNTSIGGLGLGMSIAQQIIEGHQGSIQIESEPNRGTAVTVRLPLAG